jgi:lysophospholipase L1-like esterase
VKTTRLILVLGALLPGLVSVASAQERWVATWAASPQAPRVAAPGRAGQPAPGFNNQTVRMVVHTSIGGRRARVQLSNAFGTTPLKIGAAHVALRESRDKESAIVPASDHALTFSGKASFTIPPGAEIISDPLDLDVPKLGDLVISVYVPGEVPAPTTHGTGLHTTYISKAGDFTAAPSIADATKSQAWYLISSVDVMAPPDTRLVVAYGDSITDGATSTPDTDSSWPSQLAQRLLGNKATSNVAIVNQGISGNRVLSDGAGVSALARFDRDVLAQPGVQWIIVMEGINDIGLGAKLTGDAAVTADDLIAAHKQMIERAHMRGIKVIGATLTPFAGAAYYSDEGEAIRMALNEWIRTGKSYDAVIDFDAATRDPDNPKQIRPAYNIRDHLHPNDAGYKAMADAFDLSMFTMSKR